MIKEIIDCLKLDLKSNSERIAIARGKNKLPETFKEAFKQAKKILNGTGYRG